MSTLSEFLLARIIEDEIAATFVQSAPAKWTMTVYPHDGEPIPVAAAAFDPTRVLAECEAKRRIIELARQIGWVTTDMTERLLALPYADHPDYLPEWKP